MRGRSAPQPRPEPEGTTALPSAADGSPQAAAAPAVAPAPQDKPPSTEAPEARPAFKAKPKSLPTLHPWQPSEAVQESETAWGTEPSPDSPSAPPSHRKLAWIGWSVACLLILTVAWQLTGPARQSTPVLPPPAPPTAPPATADTAREAAEVARAFLATTTLDDRLRFIRHPEATRARMAAWHTTDRPLQPLQVLSFHDRWAEERVGDATFLMMYMEMADFTQRAIAMERRPDGSLAVDWESFEYWSDVPWTTFLETEPPQAVEFRVVAEYDSYYNFNYSDADAWVCFRLTDPADQAHAWGYCPPGSAPATTLAHLLSRQQQQGNPQAKAILLLRFEPGTHGRRQLRIDAVVQEHWLKPDP